MAGRGEVASDPSGGPALGESRSRVLEVLKAVRGPLTVTEVAARVGLHPNTARFHLDGLVGQGLVERTREERDVPGRPRGLYAPSAGHRHAGRRSYRLLAQILASYLATHTTQPENGARAAGEEWGRFLADRPTPFHSVDGAAATQGLTDTLEEIGFAPEAVTADRRRKILLHHCPFREAAEQDGSVVCSVHLGLSTADKVDGIGLLLKIDPAAPIKGQPAGQAAIHHAPEHTYLVASSFEAHMSAATCFIDPRPVPGQARSRWSVGALCQRLSTAVA